MYGSHIFFFLLTCIVKFTGQGEFINSLGNALLKKARAIPFCTFYKMSIDDSKVTKKVEESEE